MALMRRRIQKLPKQASGSWCFTLVPYVWPLVRANSLRGNLGREYGDPLKDSLRPFTESPSPPLKSP